ncbi:Ppx/GppA family phosphatase [Roseomonas sp. NAR14]|uniref:Ppx/GppA family phosphatase n=1 Tax=Roseomonas acroporae TaxID=2937791 RepID=A0A9X2C0E2_9PROT|nr:Ppx/GppA phosphatase family protein [Roseomonas acroporae]MCK8788040.1 Ppx/GppA family phosphatase [Roseomonas acroporae]
MPDDAAPYHIAELTRETARQPAPAPPERAAGMAPLFAALDLGTNNCRLLIAAGTPGGGFRVLDSFSRIVRLGQGLAGTGRLAETAMDRAMAALRTCTEKLARRPVRRLHAVATEACRRAENGAAFLGRVESELGLRLQIISAREEAALAMESCSPLLAPEDRRALLFDIGGGSTEIAWIRIPPPRGRPAGARPGGTHPDAHHPAAYRSVTPELIGYTSLPLGVVTLAERTGSSCFTAAGFTAVVDEVADQLADFDRVHCISQELRAGGVRLMGTSGTVTTLAGVALSLPRYRRPLVDGCTLDIDAADQALGDLFALGPEGLAAHPCVGPERAEFVLPGCAVYAAIRRVWPARRLTVADRGLREGMLLRMLRGERGADRSSRAVPWRPRPGGAAGRPH